MTPKSIRSHLAPYSILSKRKTTVAHAFASALAPSDEYDKEKVEAALKVLGEKNLNQLTCVYCGKLAQTWDHLESLVKNGKLNGFGHQIGNLVPCCRECNSAKGGKSFHDFVGGSRLSHAQKSELISRLENHLRLANPIDESGLDEKGVEVLTKFHALREKILVLMKKADGYAQILRKKR